MTDLDQLLDDVKDRESFLRFVKALVADREKAVRMESENPSSPYGSDAKGWENWSIEQYLDASVAWMESWMGREHELPEVPSWNSFARFLYAGKYYE